MTTFTKPTKLLIEDHSVNGSELTICYAWQYENGTEDQELREYKTSTDLVEAYYNSLGWNSTESFEQYWLNQDYKTKLDFLFLFVADPGADRISNLISELVNDVTLLFSTSAIAS